MAASFAVLGPSDPLVGVDVGDPEADVQDVLRDYGFSEVRRMEKSDPQAFRLGLVKTALLETVIRAGGVPESEEGGLDPDAFSVLTTARRDDRRYTFAFGADGRLRFLLARLPVPVDAGADPDGPGWSQARLRPLRDALAALAPYRLRAVDEDRYGNRFAWRGRTSAGRVFVSYIPEQDVLRVLLRPP